MCKERKRKWQFVFFYGTLIHIYFFGWWFRMYLAHWPRWKQNHHHVWFLWNFFPPKKQICCLKSVLLAHRVYLPFSDNTELSRILVKIWHGIYSLVFSSQYAPIVWNWRGKDCCLHWNAFFIRSSVEKAQPSYFIGNKNAIFPCFCCVCSIFLQYCLHPVLNTLGKLWRTCSEACGTFKTVFCFVMFGLCVSSL